MCRCKCAIYTSVMTDVLILIRKRHAAQGKLAAVRVQAWVERSSSLCVATWHMHLQSSKVWTPNNNKGRASTQIEASCQRLNNSRRRRGRLRRGARLSG